MLAVLPLLRRLERSGSLSAIMIRKRSPMDISDEEPEGPCPSINTFDEELEIKPCSCQRYRIEPEIKRLIVRI